MPPINVVDDFIHIFSFFEIDKCEASSKATFVSWNDYLIDWGKLIDKCLNLRVRRRVAHILQVDTPGKHVSCIARVTISGQVLPIDERLDRAHFTLDCLIIKSYHSLLSAWRVLVVKDNLSSKDTSWASDEMHIGKGTDKAESSIDLIFIPVFR